MSNNLLKLLLAIGGQGANNIQISVAATKGIQKLLGFIYVAKSYAVNQLEKTAHIHGAYANKLVKGGVLLKNVKFWHNNTLKSHSTRQRYYGFLPFLALKIFVLRCFAVS